MQLDTSAPGLAFKQAIAEVTSVPTERQKVMAKGGLLKDDTDMSKLGVRVGQTFMVLGAAGELPQAPREPVKFLEDMPDDEQSRATQLRVGLVNLGNTCYLNSTLQVLRSIGPLQEALAALPARAAGDSDLKLTGALRDLYRDMGQTTAALPPLLFLSLLRQVAPQFAETAEGGGFAQQDAEEAWQRIMQALSTLPVASGSSDKFVPQYLTGRMRIERTCAELPDAPPEVSEEPVSMVQCNISSNTNEMTAGITESLTHHLEKHAEALQRTATYVEKRQFTRLPQYLAVHFVRFYWRRDIGKKTKIMRKVKFPMELDASVWATPELAQQVRPVNHKLREVEKERDDRAKVRARAKGRHLEAGAVEGSALTDEQEREARQKEAREIDALVADGLRGDIGCNASSLYELIGVVTHKGAAADAGHYMSWVRKDPDADSLDMGPASWYKFNDDQVSVVPADKIESLYGGGEDSVAYILLYRAKAW